MNEKEEESLKAFLKDQPPAVDAADYNRVEAEFRMAYREAFPGRASSGAKLYAFRYIEDLLSFLYEEAKRKAVFAAMLDELSDRAGAGATIIDPKMRIDWLPQNQATLLTVEATGLSLTSKPFLREPRWPGRTIIDEDIPCV